MGIKLGFAAILIALAACGTGPISSLPPAAATVSAAAQPVGTVGAQAVATGGAAAKPVGTAVAPAVTALSNQISSAFGANPTPTP